jgi:hypothetical protein
LLDNCSANTFPRQCPTMKLLLRDGVFCGSARRLHNEDLRQLRYRIESPVLAVSRIIKKKWQERNQAVQRIRHICCSDSETVINPLPG